MSKTKRLLKQTSTDAIDVVDASKKLTRKQAAFVKYLLDNPKASATQAVIAAYDPMGYSTAASIATENLKKPNILAVLNGAAQEAEDTLLSVMQVSKRFAANGDKVGASYASVARAAANDVLDRVHGKATQLTEVRTEAVVLNIDLTAQS